MFVWYVFHHSHLCIDVILEVQVGAADAGQQGGHLGEIKVATGQQDNSISLLTFEPAWLVVHHGMGNAAETSSALLEGAICLLW